MNFTDRVRAARNPQEAMLVLAEGIDALLARPTEAADPWGGEWVEAKPTIRPGHAIEVLAAAEAIRPDRNQAAIDAVNAELAAATDPEVVQALQAQLRLLEDDGASLTAAVPEGKRAKVTVTGADIHIDLPEASPRRKQERMAFARARNFHDMITPAIDKDAVAAAYVNGGPLWLYYYDDVAVRGMPLAWKQAMIADVAQDSELDAQELARDLLKDLDPGDAPA